MPAPKPCLALPAGLLALLLASAAQADTITASSRVTAVTLYPQGAEVTREVTFTAPAGGHDLVIGDLPLDTDPSLLRLASSDARLGAFALRTDRQPPATPPETPATTAARTALQASEAALATAQGALAGVEARIEAQTARIAFLTALKADAATQGADSLLAIATMIGSEVLAAREAAIAAEADRPAAALKVEEARKARDAAAAALDALAQGATDRATLNVAVTTTGAETHLTIKHFVEGAAWQPVYDIDLDRKAGHASLARGLLVTQYAGEDWQDIALTLSTAEPGQRSEASHLWPDLRHLADPEPPAAKFSQDASGIAAAAPEAEVAPTVTAETRFRGDIVTYHYPEKVSIASGVENLRLALDSLTLPAEARALAVPRHDETAYLEARLTNASAEILLPGTAYLYRDGMLTGATELDTLAPGDTQGFGFGAIPGLTLTREVPERMTGGRGVFAKATEMQESAVLRIENLTDEAWPVRLMDQVPYSEEEDLKITWKAEPPPSEENVDAQRGILAWDTDLAPQSTLEIRLDTTLYWPEGKTLE